MKSWKTKLRLFVISRAITFALTGLAFGLGAPLRAGDYNTDLFGGSSYAQHGPGPAYGAGYVNYGPLALRPHGRFNPSYGDANAVPGYGRFGAGSGFGSGALRAAGTGWGEHADQHGSKAKGYHRERQRLGADLTN